MLIFEEIDDEVSEAATGRASFFYADSDILLGQHLGVEGYELTSRTGGVAAQGNQTRMIDLYLVSSFGADLKHTLQFQLSL